MTRRLNHPEPRHPTGLPLVPKGTVMSVISRSTWGARRPNGFADRPIPVREFWLHHSVTRAPANNTADERAAMRQLEDIGHRSFGGGISYTYCLPPSGRLYEGHSLHRRGAHTGGHNTVAAAFSLMGNYDAGDRVTDAQMNAIARQMVALHKAGKATRHTLNGGHRDTGFATACPGRHAYPLIAEINRRANALWSGGSVPPATGGGASSSFYKPKGVTLSVKEIQKIVGVTADGAYGNATKAAVKKLQKSLGVTADGLFGPATESAYKKSQKSPASKPAASKPAAKPAASKPRATGGKR